MVSVGIIAFASVPTVEWSSLRAFVVYKRERIFVRSQIAVGLAKVEHGLVGAHGARLDAESGALRLTLHHPQLVHPKAPFPRSDPLFFAFWLIHFQAFALFPSQPFDGLRAMLETKVSRDFVGTVVCDAELPFNFVPRHIGIVLPHDVLPFGIPPGPVHQSVTFEFAYIAVQGAHGDAEMISHCRTRSVVDVLTDVVHHVFGQRCERFFIHVIQLQVQFLC